MEQDVLARHTTRWTWVAAVEVALASAAVVLDLVIPTLVLIALAVVSLVVRREGVGSLGLRSVAEPAKLALQVLGWSALWTVVTLALTTPVIEHVSGQRQNMSVFADLQGNLPLTLTLIVVSWTLAAFGEEFAYRGYLLTRLRELVPTGSAGLVAAVVVSSALFGIAHSEQGVVGVVLTFFDAVFFSVLRLHYGSLWAAVLAHGFNNTIGLSAFFLVGPIYGLW